MTITQEGVLRILRTGASQHVAFEIPTDSFPIRVNGGTFRFVADNIVSGRLTLSFPPLSPPLPPGVAAEYQAALRPSGGMSAAGVPYPAVPANTMRIQRLDSTMDRGYLLHEAVHASLDLNRCSTIRSRYDEASGYITMWLYVLACNAGARPDPRVNGDLHLPAWRIARRIRARQATTIADINVLASAVEASPIYPTMPAYYTRDG